jgi:hypothetical protein
VFLKPPARGYGELAILEWCIGLLQHDFRQDGDGGIRDLSEA